MRVAGFVLVGGRSSRMGRDKARLVVAGQLLVERVARSVSAVSEETFLVGPSHLYRDLQWPCLDDERPSLGPLSGIETALASAKGDLNLILACDMPDVTPTLLNELIAEAHASRSSCVVCRDAAGIVQPLCGVWTAGSLPAVRRALGLGRLSVQKLITEIAAVSIDSIEILSNVNTPAEWDAWQQRMASATVSARAHVD